MRLEVLANQESLHFSQFQGAQDTAKPGDAAGIAASLTDRLIHQFTPAFVLPLIHNLLGAGTNLVTSDVSQVSMKTPDQCLTDIRMQLRFEDGAVRVRAGENPLLENASFQQLFQSFGDILKMLTGLIFNPALCVAAVVAGEAITASAAGKGVEQIFALGQFAQPEIENAGAVTID